MFGSNLQYLLFFLFKLVIDFNKIQSMYCYLLIDLVDVCYYSYSKSCKYTDIHLEKEIKQTEHFSLFYRELCMYKCT